MRKILLLCLLLSSLKISMALQSNLHSPKTEFDINAVDTSNINYFIETLPAQSITTTSAILRGTAGHFQEIAVLSFEYGIDTNFTNAIPAEPDTITDSLQHSVTALLSGVTSNVMYYYRLKVVTTTGTTLHGNICAVFIGNNEVPNWDFQEWVDDTVLLPAGWNLYNNDFARVPGHNGNYALKIFGTEMAELGVLGDYFYGGPPFNARPDSISMHLDYNITPGDSGFIWVNLSKTGTSIARNVFVVTGNSSGTFQKLTFPITYQLSGSADTIELVFIPTNPFKASYIPQPSNYITIDDINCTPSSPAIINGGFENWFKYHHMAPIGWYYPEYIFIDSAGPNNDCVLRDNFNTPNDYALAIRAVVKGGMIFGFYAIDAISNSSQVSKGGGAPVSARHLTLNGYYKYTPVNGDTMRIGVRMLKNGNEIGRGIFKQSETVNTFTPFEVDIQYSDPLTIPDTAVIDIGPFLEVIANGTSLMVVDKLSFDGFVAGIDYDNNSPSHFVENGIKVYPNPSKEMVIVEIEGTVTEGDFVELYSLNGQTINELKLLPNQNKFELNLTQLDAGFYLLNVKVGTRVLNGKIVVVK